jgi:hypothetical protein
VSFARAVVRQVSGSATYARSSNMPLKILTPYTNMGGGGVSGYLVYLCGYWFVDFLRSLGC